MGARVAVIVATLGDEKWRDVAARRAVPSAVAEAPDDLIVFHGQTLAHARNTAVDGTRAEWLCFLDADDELEPGYLSALLEGSGDLRAPAVRYVTGVGPDPAPVVLEGRDMRRLNPCVIGTLIRRDLFLEAGGFWTEKAWEDWSLFRRAWLLGADVVHHPAAVYRVHVDPSGRNSTIPNPRTLHREILRTHAAWRRTKGTPR